MKAKTNKVQPDFTPVEVIITIESQAEADCLATLSNYYPVAAACRRAYNVDISKLTDTLREAGGNPHRTDKLSESW